MLSMVKPALRLAEELREACELLAFKKVRQTFLERMKHIKSGVGED